jgi:hypothetical protein
MSIPDPYYDDVEGVDLAVLRAYDAWIEEAENYDGNDIYGIGVGQTREGMTSLPDLESLALTRRSHA